MKSAAWPMLQAVRKRALSMTAGIALIFEVNLAVVTGQLTHVILTHSVRTFLSLVGDGVASLFLFFFLFLIGG